VSSQRALTKWEARNDDFKVARCGGETNNAGGHSEVGHLAKKCGKTVGRQSRKALEAQSPGTFIRANRREYSQQPGPM